MDILSRLIIITKVSNEFTYSEDCYFYYLGRSFQTPGDTNYYVDPEGVETYYGVKAVIPTADGETITIPLKRMVYGLKLIAGDFLTEGTVKVWNTSSYGPRNPIITLTPENKTAELIYTYHDRARWYGYEELSDASCSFPLKFSWTKDDGTVLTLKSQNVSFNRLKQTIINLTFYEDTAIDDAKLGVQFEDQVFVEEGQMTYTFGDNQSEYEF